MVIGGEGEQEMDQTACDESEQRLPIVSTLSNGERKNNFCKRSRHSPYAFPTCRIVTKDGRYNVFTSRIPEKNRRYFKDFGNTLISMQWRWILFGLCAANIGAYAIFAVMWTAIALLDDGSGVVPCIGGTNTTTGYMILSIETHTSIGSGTFWANECHGSWILMTLHAVVGVAIEGALVTAIFVKISRPRKDNTLMLFSKRAVISLRDDTLCLIFRIRDMYGKHWMKTTVKAAVIESRQSSEGESLQYFMRNIKLEEIGLLFWPQEVIHRITPNSPFWAMTPEQFYRCRFEILVTLEGNSISTGQPSQSQTSYTTREICWGYRFIPCTVYHDDKQKYIVENDKIDDIIESSTPVCSAQQLNLLREHFNQIE